MPTPIQNLQTFIDGLSSISITRKTMYAKPLDTPIPCQSCVNTCKPSPPVSKGLPAPRLPPPLTQNRWKRHGYTVPTCVCLYTWYVQDSTLFTWGMNCSQWVIQLFTWLERYSRHCCGERSFMKPPRHWPNLFSTC